MKELQLTQWPQNADQAGDSLAVKCPRLLSRYRARSSGRDSSIVTQMSTYFDAIHDSDNSRVHSMVLKVLSTPASWAPDFSGEEDGRMISHCAYWGHRMLQSQMFLQCNQNLFKPAMVHKKPHVTAHLHLLSLGGELGCISTAFYSLRKIVYIQCLAVIFQSCPQSGNEWTNEFINKSQSYPPYSDRVAAWSASLTQKHRPCNQYIKTTVIWGGVRFPLTSLWSSAPQGPTTLESISQHNQVDGNHNWVQKYSTTQLSARGLFWEGCLIFYSPSIWFLSHLKYVAVYFIVFSFTPPCIFHDSLCKSCSRKLWPL